MKAKKNKSIRYLTTYTLLAQFCPSFMFALHAANTGNPISGILAFACGAASFLVIARSDEIFGS